MAVVGIPVGSDQGHDVKRLAIRGLRPHLRSECEHFVSIRSRCPSKRLARYLLQGSTLTFGFRFQPVEHCVIHVSDENLTHAFLRGQRYGSSIVSVVPDHLGGVAADRANPRSHLVYLGQHSARLETAASVRMATTVSSSDLCSRFARWHKRLMTWSSTSVISS